MSSKNKLISPIELYFADYNFLHDCYHIDSNSWWVVYDSSTPSFQALALKLLATFLFIMLQKKLEYLFFSCPLKRNKMTPQCREDLIFTQFSSRFHKNSTVLKGKTKMWNIVKDKFDLFEDVEVLEFANLSLDEPKMKKIIFIDDADESSNEGDNDVENEFSDY